MTTKSEHTEHTETVSPETKPTKTTSKKTEKVHGGWGKLGWGLLGIVILIIVALLAWAVWPRSSSTVSKADHDKLVQENAELRKKLENCEPVAQPVPQPEEALPAAPSATMATVPAKKQNPCPCPPKGLKWDRLEWDGKGKLKIDVQSDNVARIQAEAEAAAAKRQAEAEANRRAQLEAIDRDRENQILEEIGRVRRQLDANERRLQQPIAPQQSSSRTKVKPQQGSTSCNLTAWSR